MYKESCYSIPFCIEDGFIVKAAVPSMLGRVSHSDQHPFSMSVELVCVVTTYNKANSKKIEYLRRILDVAIILKIRSKMS